MDENQKEVKSRSGSEWEPEIAVEEEESEDELLVSF